jgi:hypothetical protein
MLILYLKTIQEILKDQLFAKSQKLKMAKNNMTILKRYIKK